MTPTGTHSPPTGGLQDPSDPEFSAGLKQVTGPILGVPHLVRLRRHPIEHSSWLREAYGDVYRMRVFGTRMYVTNGPEAAEALLVNRDRVFASGPAWSHFIGPFFHRGLMLLDFDEHLHHRRIMQQAFSNEALRRYHAMLGPVIHERLAAWREDPAPLLQRRFKQLTLDLATEVFLGMELDEATSRRINKAFIAAVRAGTSIVRFPVPGGPWARGLAARRELEDFFGRALPDKRRDGGDDLFAQLCAARSEDGHEFSDDDVVNHMIFLLMAAHDTTTTTLTSMAYQLARHPDWQQRLRAESVAAGELDYDGQLGLTTLDLVMKESLRLCAPVPSIPRMATRDTEIAGYLVPKGSIVAVSPYQNHYLERIWRDPDQFDPMRFSEERREDKVHRMAFEPFGGGVHKCIGMHFAGMQVRAIFHELLRTYRWSVPDGYEMPIDLVALPYPRDGLPVALTPLDGSAR